MKSLAVAVAILAIGAADASQKMLTLHNLDSAEGLKPTWAASALGARIETNRDRRFVADGAASVRLSARSGPKSKGNQYLGFKIPLAPTDGRQRLLALDCWTTTPEAISALYVRLWSGERRAASWAKHGRPFQASSHLQVALDAGLASGGFAWEERGTEPEMLDRVTAVEIVIGTDRPQTPVDVYVDHLRLGAERRVPFRDVTRAKPLVRETPLARAGRPLAILVAPTGEPFAGLARRIQSHVKAISGAELPIVRPADAPPERLAGTPAVLLGNVCNNRAIQPLYGLLYTPVDDAFPAGDGYLVHTVHDPWGAGTNVVVIGASSDAGLARATDAFLAALGHGPDLVLPKLTLRNVTAPEAKQDEADRRRGSGKGLAAELLRAKADFDRGAHRHVAGRMGGLGFRYSRTGNDALATLYRDLAVAWADSHAANPSTYGGPWGMDMDFHLMEILPAWDLLEESPALSDEDRLRVTRILYEFITTDVVRKAAHVVNSKRVRFNHTTFPALGLFYAGRYFKHGYSCPEADHWLGIAEACFAFQARTAKPHEDCNSYGWLVPHHTMRYSLATLDPTYFDSGNVRRLADYAILTMDNLGYQVPYGDTGSFQCTWSEVPYLRGAEFGLRDGRYAWILEKKQAVRRFDAHYQYTTRVAPRAPDHMLGAQAWPVDKPFWDTFPGPEGVRLEKTFDKLAMRASFDADREYLLLDGLSIGGHGHFDGNSISRITDRGRIWLADNDYIRSLPKFHNSLLVFRDGRTDTLPPYCELELLADGRQQAASRTAVRDYAGADWRRSILWSKERFFLVIDELAARQPGDYDVHCMWHTVGRAQLGAQGLETEQQGPRFWIKPAAGPRLSLTDDRDLGRNWAGYAYAEPMVHSLREVQSALLEPGQRVRFANLLYATDVSRPQDYSIDPAGPQTVLLRSGQTRLVAGTGQSQSPCAIAPGVSVAAEAFLVGANSGFLAGARQLAWPGFSLESPADVTVEWSGRRLSLRAAAPVEVKLRVGDRQSVVAVKDAESVVELPDGRPQDGLAAALGQVRPLVSDGARRASASSSGKPLWTFHAPNKETVTAAAVADLDGDGRDEVIAGSEQGTIWCLGPDGRARWQFRAAGRVTAATAGQFDRTGAKYALVGSEDCKVYAFSPSGQLLWSYEMPTYKQPGRVRVLLAADLDRDGIDEIIAGGDNWRYYVLDAAGRERWHYESVHPSSAAAAVDLDGDGRRELLLGTVYYSWHCASADGSPRWRFSVKGPHATQALGVDFAGDKTRAAVFGAADGNLYVLDGQGRLLWKTNVGDEVTGAVAADLNADGRQELAASSKSFSVFVLDSTGKVVWRRGLGSPVECLAKADSPGGAGLCLLAGCQDGSVVRLDARGAEQDRYPAGAAVAAVLPARLTPDAKLEAVLRLADGRLVTVGW